MEKIRIIIADDMEEIRNHLAEKIAALSGDIDIVGVVGTGREAVKLTEELLPDVVLMDIQMETRIAGISAIAKIQELFPNVKCIALTVHEDEEFIFRAYLAGAADYIIKVSPVEKIVKSIHDVIDNKLLVRPEVARKLIDGYRQVQENQIRLKETFQVMLLINTTEYEILKMIYGGLTYRNIAELRFVQETTIRSQVNHILKKFGKKRMKDVIRQLRELKIFED
ncbi:response regulator transcription factor [Lacrimispora indolis]|uniref:response regulator transcription factor n=1 Tax=Lacrimispora indolis TaxID=69825 RepID=UPI00042A480A|nr:MULTISPECIES: response regulator transcription factor [Lachnospiraceae]MBE7721920.1 response regulator transcription factor [Lacrimispora celerecrescens]